MDATGTGTGNLGSEMPTFGSDATKVAFASRASNLGPTDTNGVLDVYLRDLTTDTTTLVSVNAGGTDSANGISGYSFPVRFRGSRIVFASAGSNFGPTDTNGLRDYYVRDLATATTALVTANADGSDGANSNVQLPRPSLSADGATVAFDTLASNFGPTDTNNSLDIYVARPRT